VDGHHRDGAPELYPERLRSEIDEVNALVVRDVNNGVYQCGLAGTQAAYETAFTNLFERLDWLTDRLTARRFLVGDTITEADVRLFTTLARFDAVYHGHFKTNRHKLTEMPVLWAYARDLFQTLGFGDTIDFPQIKTGYYNGHRDLNPTGIVAAGPDPSNWLVPSGRDNLGGRPFGDGTPPPFGAAYPWLFGCTSPPSAARLRRCSPLSPFPTIDPRCSGQPNLIRTRNHHEYPHRSGPVELRRGPGGVRHQRTPRN